MISQPIALLGVILAICAGAFWLEGRFGWASRVGSSLLVIVLGAVASNLDLVPVQSPVYDAIFGPVTSFAIVWLLLSVDLRDVFQAGPQMLGAFALAVFATAVGALVAAGLFGSHFPGDAWRLAGALTGTYAGGSVNLIAVGREVGLTDSLFAATAAADNLVTAVWVGATLMLPLWLFRFYPASREARLSDAGDREPVKIAPLDVLEMRLRDVFVLGAIAAGLTVLASKIALLTPAIPSVLWLTTLALAIGQLPAVRSLRGAFQLGLLALSLFFAVIGIGSRVSEIMAVGIEVLYFTGTVVLVHGTVAYGLAWLLRMRVETVSVASQAAVGGPSTALALAVTRGWSRLALPGVLVGLLGYAVGNYAGLAVAALVRRFGG